MHQPVLYQSVIAALQPRPGGRYVDGTLGAGGHAAGILAASAPTGQLLGLDLDPVAIELASQQLAVFGSRAIIRHASYTTLVEQLAQISWASVDGILLDLGVSSMQLDQAERGFSFLADAPLDMRFDPGNPLDAAQLVNTADESELADILFRYGEEQRSRQVARAIVRSRPLHTTRQLAEVVASATRSGRPGMHPATRAFQAIRIAVNGELNAIEAVLPQALAALAPGGRLAVISFHSLEDRLVKTFLRRESCDCLCPPRQPLCTCGHRAALREITRRPLAPAADEIAANPRSRSARMRVAEKLGEPAPRT